MTLATALDTLRSADRAELDLSDLVHDRSSHADTSDLSFLAWGLLCGVASPSRVILPEALATRRVIARAGLSFAAERRGIDLAVGDETISAATALRPLDGNQSASLPGFDWKRCDGLLEADDGSLDDRLTRLRIVTDLEDPARRPPPPDDDQRRYRWIDGTGAASALEDVEARRFNADSDQVLYEAIDNVHEWAFAQRALACCSVTRGGGDKSFNRLHIVVIDDGRGVIQSVDHRRQEDGLGPWREVEQVSEIARAHEVSSEEGLLRLLVLEALGGRQMIAPTDEGQGLHAIGLLSQQWSGTFRWLTADGSRCVSVGRDGSSDDLRSESFAATGLRGTALHITMDAKARARDLVEASSVRRDR